MPARGMMIPRARHDDARVRVPFRVSVYGNVRPLRYVHNDDRSGWGCWKATRKGAPQTYKAYPPAEEEQETLNEVSLYSARAIFL